MKRGSQGAFEVAKPARHSANTPLYELYEVDLSRASLLDDEENSLKAHERKVMVILLRNAFEYSERVEREKELMEEERVCVLQKGKGKT